MMMMMMNHIGQQCWFVCRRLLANIHRLTATVEKIITSISLQVKSTKGKQNEEKKLIVTRQKVFIIFGTCGLKTHLFPHAYSENQAF